MYVDCWTSQTSSCVAALVVPTPLGPPIGANSLHSLVQLLTGRGANLATAGMQLPAGYCPEPHQQQQSADDRVGRNAAPAGQHAGQAVSQQAGQTAPVNGQTAAAHSWRLSTTNVLPMGPTGIRLSLEHSVAESITLRGKLKYTGAAATVVVECSCRAVEPRVHTELLCAVTVAS